MKTCQVWILNRTCGQRNVKTSQTLHILHHHSPSLFYIILHHSPSFYVLLHQSAICMPYSNAWLWFDNSLGCQSKFRVDVNSQKKLRSLNSVKFKMRQRRKYGKEENLSPQQYIITTNTTHQYITKCVEVRNRRQPYVFSQTVSRRGCGKRCATGAAHAGFRSDVSCTVKLTWGVLIALVRSSTK